MDTEHSNESLESFKHWENFCLHMEMSFQMQLKYFSKICILRIEKLESYVPDN